MDFYGLLRMAEKVSVGSLEFFLDATFPDTTPLPLARDVVPSNICLPMAFPRSYVRTMQPILQFAHNMCKKTVTPYRPLSITSFSSKLE
jgi:hypothetical protein